MDHLRVEVQTWETRRCVDYQSGIRSELKEQDQSGHCQGCRRRKGVSQMNQDPRDGFMSNGGGGSIGFRSEELGLVGKRDLGCRELSRKEVDCTT